MLRVFAEPLDDRDAEAEGLARSGLGLADDVLAGKAEGDGLLLDGERVDDALRGQRVEDVLIDTEISERSHLLCCLSGGFARDASRHVTDPRRLLCHRRGALLRRQDASSLPEGWRITGIRARR